MVYHQSLTHKLPMARLSAVGAPATPDQTDQSEEQSSTGAGAMTTSNASINPLQRDNA